MQALKTAPKYGENTSRDLVCFINIMWPSQEIFNIIVSPHRRKYKNDKIATLVNEWYNTPEDLEFFKGWVAVLTKAVKVAEAKRFGHP